jgi:molybdate transport system ATP-binding protein
VPMLYVTHALDEVDRLADALVLMAGGRVLAAGSLEALSLRTDLPLAARRDAGAVLTCAVLAHHAGRGLSRLGFAGGELLVPLQAAAVGTRLRVRVRARDISVATVRPEGLSVQNVLPAVLEAIVPGQAHEAMLRLRVGESALLARVTGDAAGRLGLAPGMPVWALVKSVSLGDDRRSVEV